MIGKIASTVFLISPIIIGFHFSLIALTGKLIIYAGSIIFFWIAIKENKTFKIDTYLILSSLFAFWIIIRSDNLEGISLALQAIVPLSLSIVFFDTKKSPLFFHSGFFFTILLFCAILEFTSPQILFANKNYLAVMIAIYCLPFGYQLQSHWKKIIFSLIYLIIIVISNSRAVLIGVIFSFLISLGLTKRKRRKITRFIYWISLMILLMLSIWFTDTILTTEDYLSSYNEVVFSYTGKHLETGRLEMWKDLISSLNFEEIFVGKGGGVLVSSILKKDLSAHSLYIHIIFTYGLIGFFIFIILVTSGIVKLYKKNTPTSFSLMLSLLLLLRDFFEQSLVNNSFPIAILFWSFIITGLLDPRKNPSQKNYVHQRVQTTLRAYEIQNRLGPHKPHHPPPLPRIDPGHTP